MADKTQTQKTPDADAALSGLSQLQDAGFGQMLGMSSAWMEALTDMGAEVIAFMADRIKEDVKTQHEIMHCKNVTELQHIQAQFIQNAIDQYREETGKLVEMSSSALTPKKDD